MADEKKTGPEAEVPGQEPKEEPKQEWTPASPIKRLWAWVGVVYMVIFVLLTTYSLAHGSYLTGIGPLMLIPILCGIGTDVILRYRAGRWPGGRVTCILVSGAGFLLAVLNLVRGLPSLLSQL